MQNSINKNFKINEYKILNKNFKNKDKTYNKFIKKVQQNIVDEFLIRKKFDFNKYNLNYCWKDEDFTTIFTKKYEQGNIIYLVCNKRGYNSKKFQGKLKYNKETGKVFIYSKCINNNNHLLLNYDKFREFYNKDLYNNIDMNILFYKKLFIKCLLKDNIADDYTEFLIKFKKNFLILNLF